MDKTNLIEKVREESSGTYKVKKTEKVSRGGGERGYEEERLVHK